MAATARGDRILVIGGGIIGVATALELAGRGAPVTVAEAGRIGHGCSYGNAGWLTPCFATPLAVPGMLPTVLRWMLDPESPLYVKPEPRASLARWLVGYARAARESRFAAGVAALVPLSTYSLEAYEAWSRELPEPFGFERRGLLMVGESDAGARAAAHEVERMARHGIPGRVLDAAGLREIEPALEGSARGGAFFPREAHVEPLLVVRALAAEAARRGAVLLEETEVYDFEIRAGRVRAALTSRGPLAADRFVLATGAWSKALARRLGVDLPILGGKGYAVVVEDFDPKPAVPIKIVERRIAITPRASGVRLAGTLELVDQDLAISPRRVEAIVRGARAHLRVPDPPRVVEVWRGLRPCAPDGMPVIGPARGLSNLVIASGHQMLGLHTAPGSARLAADLVLGAAPSFDPAPFRADRFRPGRT